MQGLKIRGLGFQGFRAFCFLGLLGFRFWKVEKTLTLHMDLSMSKDMRDPLRANVGFAANMFCRPFAACKSSEIEKNIQSIASHMHVVMIITYYTGGIHIYIYIYFKLPRNPILHQGLDRSLILVTAAGSSTTIQGWSFRWGFLQKNRCATYHLRKTTMLIAIHIIT